MQTTERLREVKYLLKRGEITFEKAKEMAEPLLRELNERGKQIAKEFGKRYNPITFTYFMR